MSQENINEPLSNTAVSVSVTDVRFGNLIRNDYGEIQPVYSVDEKSILTKVEENGCSICFKPKPIQINEDLLLKIGAIKLDFKEFPSFNLLVTQINFINGLWIDYATRVEIKGLPHLQNIFFFRNSEELQISEH